MRIKIQDQEIPFPLTTIRSRLRLCGLDDLAVSQIVSDIRHNHSKFHKIQTQLDISELIRDALSSESPRILKNYDTLYSYEHLRGVSNEVPPVILALEGASATGKSMLALDLVKDLVATRFVSTDTVRQILRGIVTQQEHPELYCHTYQAYKHKQSGDENLHPVIRGYLAQLEIIEPHIIESIKRILAEGAIAVVEGVHLQPGSIKHLSSSTLEVLIDPSEETHKAMFTTKYSVGKLKSVSDNVKDREEEFLSARKIQEYMIHQAKMHQIPSVDLVSYDDAYSKIADLIIERIERLIRDHR